MSDIKDLTFISSVEGEPDIEFTFGDLIDVLRGCGTIDSWPSKKHMQELIVRLDWAGMYQFKLKEQSKDDPR